MFNIEVKLPSGKSRRIQELKNRQYHDIVKYCENNDLKGLSDYFEDLYLDRDLDIFDRFYLLIYIRMMFVHENLIFTAPNQREVNISLAGILERLEYNYKDLSMQIKYKNISIDVDIPNCTYFESIDNLFIDIIKKISINGKEVYFMSLENSQKQEVLDRLPSGVFIELKKYIDIVSDNLLDIVILDGDDTFEVEEIKLNIIGNSAMRFISNIYSNDLKSYYELIYAFYQHIAKGSDIFFDITPVESRILLNIHNKHIQKENEELQKQNQA